MRSTWCLVLLSHVGVVARLQGGGSGEMIATSHSVNHSEPALLVTGSDLFAPAAVSIVPSLVLFLAFVNGASSDATSTSAIWNSVAERSGHKARNRKQAIVPTRVRRVCRAPSPSLPQGVNSSTKKQHESGPQCYLWYLVGWS